MTTPQIASDVPPEMEGQIPVLDPLTREKQDGDLKNNDANDHQPAAPLMTPLHAHQDARALVRLIQCPQCSRPFNNAVTLPCGKSICRKCLPDSHRRENVSYPFSPSRQTVIKCPFDNCRQDHCLDDCNPAVIMQKLMDFIRNDMLRMQSQYGHVQTLIHELPGPQCETEKGHSRELSGGRIVATFVLAEHGELSLSSDCEYSTVASTMEESQKCDDDLLDLLKHGCHQEVDCHVCYSMMLDPVTTPCGHTFCRKCLARILDHSSLCPHCRRDLPLPSSLSSYPSNQSLVDLLLALCPEQIAERTAAMQADELNSQAGFETPLFVCTVAFPRTPMMLHIFEPRYRLMIRRALETNSQFGMLTYNSRQIPQGHLGNSTFMEVGTMLQIETHHLLPDGRSFLLCKGLWRFKVLEHDILDGYVVGRVQRLEDVSLAEEEQLEAQETANAPPVEDPLDPAQCPIDTMPTSELLRVGTDFMDRALEQSASWINTGLLQIYGPMPRDPALFPYWFAAIVPLHDMEKYKLLPTQSVRERLKIVARWVHRIEAQRCSCTVL